ncbi:MAG: urease accessory protein UreD [Pseudomonadota bacterium]
MIADLRMSGALKALFPQGRGLEAILMNSAGGITGGDRLAVSATAGRGTTLTLTTQAAERAYRAAAGAGRVATTLEVQDGALLQWLPQEMILFDGCALERELKIAMAPGARLLMVEPIVFGRTAMGETLTTGLVRDTITITRDGVPHYLDRIHLSGPIASQLQRSAVAEGARAMASLVYIAPDAPSQIEVVRRHLPQWGGASLRAADTLVVRLLARDSFELRRALLPILDRLSRSTLPTSWRL